MQSKQHSEDAEWKTIHRNEEIDGVGLRDSSASSVLGAKAVGSGMSEKIN